MINNKKYFFLYAYYLIIPVFVIYFCLIGFFSYLPLGSVKIISGPKDGFFSNIAEGLQTDLASYGIKVEIEYINKTTDIIDLVEQSHTQEAKIGFLAHDVRGKDYGHVYSLGAVAFEPLLIFSRLESGITDIRGLKGKRLAVGPAGSGVRDLIEKILSFYGINDRNTQFLNLQFYDASGSLIDGHADAAFFLLPVNNPVISNLVKHEGLRLIAIQEAKALSHKVEYLTDVSIPRGAFQIEPLLPNSKISTIALPVSVIMNENTGVGLGGLVAAILAKNYDKEKFFSEENNLPDFFYDEIRPLPIAKDLYSNGEPAAAQYFGLKYGLIIAFASDPIFIALASLIVLWGIIITYTEIIPVLLTVVRLFKRT